MKITRNDKNVLNIYMRNLGYEQFNKIGDIEKYLENENKSYTDFINELKFLTKTKNEITRNIENIKKELRNKNIDFNYIAKLDFKINEGVKLLTNETSKTEYIENINDTSFINTMDNDNIYILKSYYGIGKNEKIFEKLKSEHGEPIETSYKYLNMFYDANINVTFKNGEKKLLPLRDILKKIDDATMFKFIENARKKLSIPFYASSDLELSEIIIALGQNNSLFNQFSGFLKDDVIKIE